MPAYFLSHSALASGLRWVLQLEQQACQLLVVAECALLVLLADKLGPSNILLLRILGRSSLIEINKGFVDRVYHIVPAAKKCVKFSMAPFMDALKALYHATLGAKYLMVPNCAVVAYHDTEVPLYTDHFFIVGHLIE